MKKNEILWKLIVLSVLPMSLCRAESSTWTGVISGDLNTSGNWSDGIPSSTIEAIFDSTATSEFALTATTTNFSVSEIDFPNSASPFSFTFTDIAVSLGTGITGAATNTALTLNNTNTSLPGSQLSFSNSTSNTSGTATFHVNNSSSSVSSSVNGSQIAVSGPFLAETGGEFVVTNIGTSSSNALSSAQIGYVGGFQILSNSTFTCLDNATIEISNSGTNGSSATGSSNSVGFVDAQFFTFSSFDAGNNLTFSVANTGVESSSGAGSNLVGLIDSQQVTTIDSFTALDNASITISNSGTNSAGSNVSDDTICRVNMQFIVQGAFNAGNDLTIHTTNSGTDGGTGTNNSTGVAFNGGLQFADSFTALDDAVITASNTGTYNGSGSSNSVGCVSEGAPHIYFLGAVSVNNGFNLDVTNSGTDNSTGLGQNTVGSNSGDQVNFGSTFTALDSATLTLSNTGTSTTSGSGSFTGLVTGDQVFCIGAMTVGNDFNLSVSNSGTNSGSGTSNKVGYIDNPQVSIIGAFQAGDSLTMTVTNEGEDLSSGAVDNSVGFTGEQLNFNSTCTIGDDATITVSNSGINTNTSSSSSVGVVSNQFNCTGAFTAGTNLNLSVTNSKTSGGGSAVVGKSGTQISFEGLCTIGDGALMAASNTGTTNDSQIRFINGFALTSGTATFHAVNSGTLNGYGIYVQGSCLGGDVDIILEGSSLNVSTTASSFTIGALNGNSTSVVLSSVPLIINTDSSVTATFAGSIQTLSSSLTKAGLGKQILSGTSTYTGTTQISGGILSISSTSNISTNAVILSGGTLEITSPITLPNAFAVTSSSTLTSSDATVLSGLLTASGVTTLTLSGSGSNSLGQIAVTSDIFTVVGEITGTQNLVKTGAGALLLLDTSSYTGKTYVEAGSLIVNGNITSSPDPIVSSGALLSGTGTVGDTIVYGVIKGGNPLGTLTVTGNLILEPGSHFGTVVTPGVVSLVDVSGTVTIVDSNSAYAIAFAPGNYHDTSVVVLSATGGISGEFSGVTADSLGPVFLSGVLTYTGTEVLLGLQGRSVTALATGGNAIQVANALDSAIAFNRTNVTFTIEPGPTITASPPAELPDLLISLVPLTTEKEITYALNQLHPAEMKGMAISQENNAVRVREALSQRLLNEIDVQNCSLSGNDASKKDLNCKHNQKTMTAWVGGLGDTLVQDNKNNYWGPLTGYRVNTGGVVTGIDGMFSEYFYAGALGAYTHSHLHFKDGKGTGNISTGYAGVYFSAVGTGSVGKMFYGNLSVIGSWSDYNADRHIQYGDVNLTAKNHHGGNQLLSHADTGLNLDYLGITIRPFDSFDYMTQTERGYAESNAGEWELTIGRKNAIMIRNELGLQFAKCYCFGASKWILSPKISWVREVRIKGDTLNVRFTGGTDTFFIQGYFPDRSLVAPGLAITGMMMQDALTFDLYYNGEFTGGYSSNSVGGQVGYCF